MSVILPRFSGSARTHYGDNVSELRNGQWAWCVPPAWVTYPVEGRSGYGGAVIGLRRRRQDGMLQGLVIELPRDTTNIRLPSIGDSPDLSQMGRTRWVDFARLTLVEHVTRPQQRPVPNYYCGCSCGGCKASFPPNHCGSRGLGGGFACGFPRGNR